MTKRQRSAAEILGYTKSTKPGEISTAEAIKRSQQWSKRNPNASAGTSGDSSNTSNPQNAQIEGPNGQTVTVTPGGAMVETPPQNGGSGGSGGSSSASSSGSSSGGTHAGRTAQQTAKTHASQQNRATQQTQQKSTVVASGSAGASNPLVHTQISRQRQYLQKKYPFLNQSDVQYVIKNGRATPRLTSAGKQKFQTRAAQNEIDKRLRSQYPNAKDIKITGGAGSSTPVQADVITGQGQHVTKRFALTPQQRQSAETTATNSSAASGPAIVGPQTTTTVKQDNKTIEARNQAASGRLYEGGRLNYAGNALGYATKHAKRAALAGNLGAALGDLGGGLGSASASISHQAQRNLSPTLGAVIPASKRKQARRGEQRIYQASRHGNLFASIYEGGEGMQIAGQDISKGVEALSPLDRVPVVGPGIDRGVGTLAGGIPFVAGTAVEAAGVAGMEATPGPGIELLSPKTTSTFGQTVTAGATKTATEAATHPVETATILAAPYALGGAADLARGSSGEAGAASAVTGRVTDLGGSVRSALPEVSVEANPNAGLVDVRPGAVHDVVARATSVDAGSLPDVSGAVRRAPGEIRSGLENGVERGFKAGKRRAMATAEGVGGRYHALRIRGKSARFGVAENGLGELAPSLPDNGRLHGLRSRAKSVRFGAAERIQSEGVLGAAHTELTSAYFGGAERVSNTVQRPFTAADEFGWRWGYKAGEAQAKLEANGLPDVRGRIRNELTSARYGAAAKANAATTALGNLPDLTIRVGEGDRNAASIIDTTQGAGEPPLRAHVENPLNIEADTTLGNMVESDAGTPSTPTEGMSESAGPATLETRARPGDTGVAVEHVVGRGLGSLGASAGALTTPHQPTLPALGGVGEHARVAVRPQARTGQRQGPAVAQGLDVAQATGPTFDVTSLTTPEFIQGIGQPTAQVQGGGTALDTATPQVQDVGQPVDELQRQTPALAPMETPGQTEPPTIPVLGRRSGSKQKSRSRSAPGRRPEPGSPDVFSSGWFNETVTSIATKATARGGHVSRQALSTSAPEGFLTGEFPTYEQLYGSKQTKAAIKQTEDLFSGLSIDLGGLA